ncbi:WxL domain-containing protein [Enterococcus sp. LJL51]|uniref:WxL domain-containing protein n=1 Tax=Enterococcus sp. LJL51 TaxID=3416656 RepID=UPI003CE7589B
MKKVNHFLIKAFLLLVLTAFSFLIENTKAAATELDMEAETEKVLDEMQPTQASGQSGKPQTRADEYVTIPDDVLREEIIWRLNYYNHLNLVDNGPSNTVTREQMELMTSFYFTRTAGKSITTLEGIQYALNIKTFDLTGGRIVEDSFTSLPAGFNKLKLEVFKVNEGALTNIDELKNMTTLKEVTLSHNNLSDLTGLQGTTNLETLVVSRYADYYANQMDGIKDFTGLEDSTKLKTIIFSKYDDDAGPTRVAHGESEPSYDGHGLQSLKGLNCADTLETLNLGGHPGLKSLDGLENYKALKEVTCVGGPSYSGRRQEYIFPPALVNDKSLSVEEKLIFETDTHTEMYRVRGLQGEHALDALKSCPSLKQVNVANQAIESLNGLSGHSELTYVNATRNRVSTLKPLADCLALEELYMEFNLLSDLKGLNQLDKLRKLDCSQQTGGARTTNDFQVNAYVSNYVVGLLKDITDLNPTSLEELRCSNNRLVSLEGLEVPAKLKSLYAYSNNLSDTKGPLKGCVSLEEVRLSNNYYKSFADMGLQDSKDSLKELYINEQGITPLTSSMTSHAEGRLLSSLEGLENMNKLEIFLANCNLIDDANMQFLPSTLTNLQFDYNEVTSAGFAHLGKMKDGNYLFSSLKTLYADSNYIGDVRPIENLPALSIILMRSQIIRIPQHGGTMTIIDDSLFRGIELDILNTERNLAALSINKGPFGTWHSLDHLFPELKAGTPIVRIRDDQYDLYNDSTLVGFEYTSFSTGAGQLSNVYIDGRIIYPDVPYDLANEAVLSIIPDKTEVEVGDTVTWTVTLKGENDHLLRKPRFFSSRNNTAGIVNHTLETAYPDPEYKYGVRIDINGVHLPLGGGVWGTSVSELNKKVNNDNVAVIKIVTRVGSGNPGDEVKFTFGSSGDNYTRKDCSAAVTIKSSILEELRLIKVPDRLDFGRNNQSEKAAKAYNLSEQDYDAQDKTDGFYLQVYDSNQGSNRTAWQVSGKLSQLKNSSGQPLETSGKHPVLTFKEMSLEKVEKDSAGVEKITVIPDTDTSAPAYLKELSFIAGGESRSLSTADINNGAGTWNIRIPFHNITLSVPENVSGKAGYEYSGLLTWTLDAVP